VEKTGKEGREGIDATVSKKYEFLLLVQDGVRNSFFQILTHIIIYEENARGIIRSYTNTINDYNKLPTYVVPYHISQWC
jgi:hypothetical protein